ncbi:transitional endoplasmic reticulum ATPase [Asanoa hainanensis]|uniref:Transitional endoplasmic reticulum ATPase n=1 Tax=Asanoa hainanensis TaxID=560556 RepID=A0A239P474_9ACTN|nr:AAA family ATPase [Asanoa hainanensis]SNT61876.1 transitional endoplasmic reticulum ATPase [Asanoa hainanensis]
MADRDLVLTVSLRPAALDARRGIVRLHPDVLSALGLRPGDPVRLTGRRTTAGIVAPGEPSDGRGLLHADDLMLGNLGVRDGAQVTVAPAPVVAARRATLRGAPGVVAVVSPEMLRLALLGKVISTGDDVSLLPQDVVPDEAARSLVAAARQSLANRVGYAWTSTLLTVADVAPSEAALVTMDTVVGWESGQITQASGVRTTAGRVGPGGAAGAAGAGGAASPGGAAGSTGAGPGGPASAGEAGSDAQDGHAVIDGDVVEGSVVDENAPSVDDLPGLRNQAHQLTELLDLGFHHRDVLTRLATSVSLGVLVTGAAGSGKSDLVRAVSAAVGARLLTVWAPEIAALTPDSAAARLRAVAAERTTDPPTVVLVTDVEALAPRENPGPLATVFRRVLGDLVAAGAAVVCTSSRPEEIDPALRAPDLLSLEISVPLPDQAMRREQLAVLTRSTPLAGDVQLDDVAARTPGFVAADLAALVREAGVRAALRQRTAETPLIAAEDFAAALEVVRPTSMASSTLELSGLTLDDVGDLVEVKEVLTESVLWPLTYPDTFARLGVRPPRGVLLYGPPGCGKTFLVTALAGSGKANVLSVKGAELLNKWVGESERAVRELFRRAREAAPTLIFLDEVDALAPMRGQSTDGGTTDRVVAALLTELDGIETLRDVVVIGATNRPDLIDPALLRPGRLERLVFVPPPDAAARAEILKAAAKGVPLDPEVDLVTLGRELDGFSAADCSALVREAALVAIRESLEATSVTAKHVAAARQRVRPSLDPVQVARLEAYAQRR